jgi:Rieske Fe-S protein
MPKLPSRREVCLGGCAGIALLGCGSGGGNSDGGRDFATRVVDDLAAPSIDLYDPTCPKGFLLNAGPASSFAVGDARFYACSQLFVCRDAGGIYAMTAICTHQGCDVNFVPGQQQFQCPCHGSTFDFNGNVLIDPATAPLPHIQADLDGNGDVIVTINVNVDPATRILGTGG